MLPRRTLLCFICALICVPTQVYAQAQSAPVAVLRDVEVIPGAGAERVVFDFSQVPAFHDFALAPPPRAVLDMAATRSAWTAHALNTDAVHGIRLAQRGDGALRAVLDLAPGVQLIGAQRVGRQIVVQLKGGGSAPSGAASSPVAANAGTANMASAGAIGHAARERTVAAVAPVPHPIVVVIDPGHGGKDPGTSGPNGLREKTVTLAIGRAVYRDLARVPGIHPVLTRDSDHFVTLPGRVAIAQRHHADVFVSIHGNASPHHPEVDGGSCYELSEHGASNAEAAQVAHFENSRDTNLAGVHFSATDQRLNTVLTQLFQNESIDAADRLAQRIIGRFATIEPIYHRAPLKANFAVLRDPMVTSVLCETAFLSNPTQARQLHQPVFLNQLADAIAGGIIAYLHDNPPMHVEPAPQHVYIVRNGDTLSALAAADGVPAAQLMAINDLRSRTLQHGQRLILPNPLGPNPLTPNPHALRTAAHVVPAQRYTVQPGDTLTSIAGQHNISPQRLEVANDLHGPDIRSGQVLRVPVSSS